MSDIYLISSELRSTSANNSNTVTCTQNSHLTTAEAFIFFVSYVSVGGFNDLTIDENSKTLTIDPNYNEELVIVWMIYLEVLIISFLLCYSLLLDYYYKIK